MILFRRALLTLIIILSLWTAYSARRSRTRYGRMRRIDSERAGFRLAHWLWCGVQRGPREWAVMDVTAIRLLCFRDARWDPGHDHAIQAPSEWPLPRGSFARSRRKT